MAAREEYTIDACADFVEVLVDTLNSISIASSWSAIRWAAPSPGPSPRPGPTG